MEGHLVDNLNIKINSTYAIFRVIYQNIEEDIDDIVDLEDNQDVVDNLDRMDFHMGPLAEEDTQVVVYILDEQDTLQYIHNLMLYFLLLYNF